VRAAAIWAAGPFWVICDVLTSPRLLPVFSGKQTCQAAAGMAQRKSGFLDFESHIGSAQLVLIFEVAAALERFARFGLSRMATRFTFFRSDPACFEPRLCAAYSWPSTGATCGGSLPR
jgi:hypothetical protein